jgi:hypothetical protein
MAAPDGSAGMRDRAVDVQRRLAPYETDVADKASALNLLLDRNISIGLLVLVELPEQLSETVASRDLHPM